MAMGGAYALATALESNESIEQALAEYEARLRPFVEELQSKSRKFAGNFIPSSRFGLWLSALMVRSMSYSWVKRFVARQFSIQSLFEREAQSLQKSY